MKYYWCLLLSYRPAKGAVEQLWRKAWSPSHIIRL